MFATLLEHLKTVRGNKFGVCYLCSNLVFVTFAGDALSFMGSWCFNTPSMMPTMHKKEKHLVRNFGGQVSWFLVSADNDLYKFTKTNVKRNPNFLSSVIWLEFFYCGAFELSWFHGCSDSESSFLLPDARCTCFFICSEYFWCLNILSDAGPPTPASHLREVFYRMGLDDKVATTKV